MPTKFTRNTLYLSIIIRPQPTVTVQISLKQRIRSTSERVKEFSATIFDTYADPVTTTMLSLGLANEESKSKQ